MKLFMHWLFGAIAIWVAAHLVPGVSATLSGALVGAIVLAALNLFLKPILRILTLPITLLTLGLFSLVVNALIILLVSHFVPGFVVLGFVPAVICGIVLSVLNAVFHTLSRT